MFFHVEISGSPNRVARLYNLSVKALRERVLVPWVQGDDLIAEGKTFDLRDRVDLTIYRGPELEKSELRLGGAGWSRVVQEGEEVTEEYVSTPPHARRGLAGITSEPMDRSVEDRRIVGLVYGRNLAANGSLRAFLRSLDLKPLEWDQLVSRTGVATPYTGHVVEQIFAAAQAVVVLFTPDDLAQLREECRLEGEARTEAVLRGQPRSNVIFEAGMAFGLQPSRTVIATLGDLRPISDLNGRSLVRFDGSPAPLRRLVQRLKDADCRVDDSGGEWLDPNAFPGLDPSRNGSVRDRPSSRVE